ncbi:MAG TPA: MFS transporter, partial [Candidatus Dormibacteraeota bacterium]|nr:MFS transporter [Candidatus Dormibacteraeota bacterium]
RKSHPPLPEIFASLAANWKIILVGMMLSTMTTVCFYLITAYTPTYGRAVLHLTNRQSLVVTLFVGISNFIWLPVGGAISDKLGRRPMLIFFTIATIVTAYPAMLWLVSSPSVARLLLVELWLSVIFGVYNGAMVPYLTEIMPPDIRTSGFSVAFSLATAIFGGFTPAICTYLIHTTGNRAMPAIWLSFAALCGLSAALILGWQGIAVGEMESSTSVQ